MKPKPPAPPATENLDYIAVTDYASYRANFSCSVQGITVNGQIRMAKDSVVWLSINKIVELGRAKLTPNRVQFSDCTRLLLCGLIILSAGDRHDQIQYLEIEPKHGERKSECRLPFIFLGQLILYHMIDSGKVTDQEQ